MHRIKKLFDKKVIYKLLAVLGVILWIAETAYFGFNDKPTTGAEKALDFLALYMIVWGAVGDVFVNSHICVHRHYDVHVDEKALMAAAREHHELEKQSLGMRLFGEAGKADKKRRQDQEN